MSNVPAQEEFTSGIKINIGYLSWGICGNSHLAFRIACLQYVGTSGSSGFIPAGKICAFTQYTYIGAFEDLLHLLQTYDKRKTQGLLSRSTQSNVTMRKIVMVTASYKCSN